jgi:hypothetical protein
MHFEQVAADELLPSTENPRREGPVWLADADRSGVPARPELHPERFSWKCA